MIVEKAMNMASLMNVPILGLVENMSYYICPECGAKHSIFGESHIDSIAEKFTINTVCKLPIDPKMALAADNGTIELMENEDLKDIIDVLKKIDNISRRIAVTFDNGEIFQHFGHTEKFKLYDVENGTVSATYLVDTNGSGHGALASFLVQYDVDTLICGGIGGGARNALESVGIEIFSGASGNADEAVKALISGNLDYDPEYVCTHHEHHGSNHNCGNHGCGEHNCHN